ncbi:lipid droplet-associated protein [Saccharopolyspora mangrovi]|uniref:Lipid droplet-associated protein n=1 Tax=Saccharopolyspora mangrovi TaxID=3082379 RepID=A0ABU6A3P9_9PSEU|nr:lipid droplet-associated protein [Saccharopolyspora sp. S2-29]MEB3366062.1 lipid droplet-associated protein [Saccharopolyspora sp. S2-29]
MSEFPLPVRVAAGLAATAVEQARSLPATLLGLPVTVASQTLQASMRVQQHITELAIKGDEALSVLRTPEEQPSWATFDEDTIPEPVPEAEPQESSLLADYDELSLPQLRGRLRSYTEDDLTELLAHEERNAQRPDYLRMLRNRLTRLREQ